MDRQEGDLLGIDFGKMISDAAKGVSDFIVKTGDDIAKAIDQNGDGKLDIADLQTVSDRIKAGQAEAQRKADLARLKPLFLEDFEGAEFVMPKMICVGEIDKPHADNAVCKGSVGFKTVMNDMSVITIYRDHIGDFDLSFYPELDNNVYYVDPCDRDQYVSLDDYFAYMKMQRVAELQRIAQSLGAKHFKVTFIERNASVAANAVHVAEAVNVAKAKEKVDVKHAVDSKEMAAMTIEAEMRFPGHAPIRPELHYLKKEINISNLIEMRMDPLSPLQHQRFNIEMSKSSGIKVQDAVKIDAMLKILKVTSSTSIVSAVKKEERSILQYEIEF